MDPHELYGRYCELQKYVGWTSADAARVCAIAELLEPHLPTLADDFYAEVNRHPNARRVITGGRKQAAALQRTLMTWLRDLLCGAYDRPFVLHRWRVGAKHVDIGLEQTYVIAALSRLRKGVNRALRGSWTGDQNGLLETIESVNMLLDMDLAIIQDAYEDEYKTRLRRPAGKE